MSDEIFYYIPLDLWKEIGERFLDPTSFGRLRQVNKALRDKLDHESKEKMIKRCSVITRFCGFVFENFRSCKYLKETDMNGSQSWFMDGNSHRDGDLPAVIFADGTQWWYKKGMRHRDGDLPAIIKKNGEKWWYKNGEIHRDNDLPAAIKEDGSQYWCKEGCCHRENNLPAVIEANGSKEWWVNGVKIKVETEFI